MFDLKVMKGLAGVSKGGSNPPGARRSALPIMDTMTVGGCIGGVVKLCGLGLMSSANLELPERALSGRVEITGQGLIKTFYFSIKNCNIWRTAYILVSGLFIQCCRW